MNDRPELHERPEPDKVVDRAILGVVQDAEEANPELVMTPKDAPQNYVKMAIDFGPITAFGLAFFVGNLMKFADKTEALIIASGVLGAASLVALVAGLILEKRLAWIPLLSCLITIPFAILTVVFHNTQFVKIKMTIVDALIGALLLGGVVFKKAPLKALLGETLRLKESAWPPLTIFYAIFYFVMAAANEIIWRTQSDSFWVSWKLFSIIGGPLLFSVCLMPFLMKNMIPPSSETGSDKAA